MYATVRRYEGASDPSEVARLVDEGFLPIIREIEGFVDYYFVDTGLGRTDWLPAPSAVCSIF